MNAANGKFLHPEDKLIVQCSQLSLSQNQIDEIRELIGPHTDWEYVIKVGNSHTVMALVFQSLQRYFAENVPEPVFERLRRQFKTNLMHNLFLKSELLNVLRQFNSNNIPVIAFKGPFFADLIYSNLALRVFADLDILVHEDDRKRSEELLINLGYDYTFDEIEKKRIQREAHHYRLRKSASFLTIELHWRLAERFWHAWSDPRLLWDNTSLQLYESIPFLCPRIEDYLLYICNHGFRHTWERLGWLCDLASLIETYGDTLDWSYLIERAREFKSERILFLGLALMRDLWPNKTLPEQIASRVESDRSSKMVELVSCALTGHSAELSQIDRFMIRYHMLGRDQSNWGYFRYTMRPRRLRFKPNASDFEWVSIPEKIRFLYYVLRPIRLTFQYGLKYFVMWLRVAGVLVRLGYKRDSM
jgi:hypothetical protein